MTPPAEQVLLPRSDALTTERRGEGMDPAAEGAVSEPSAKAEPATRNGAPAEERLWALESVRGLAALAVVNLHFFELFAQAARNGTSTERAGTLVTQLLTGLDRTPFRVALDGIFAVRVFFVLSGFVLALGYLRNRSERVLRSAAVKRLPRLGIPAVTSIAISFVLFSTGLAKPDRLVSECSSWLDTTRAAADTIPDPTVSGALREAKRFFYFGTLEPSYNRALWTMSIELFGSMLVFAVLAICGTSRRRWALYALVILFLVPLEQYYYIDFIVGVMIAERYMSPTARGRSRETLTGELLVIGGLLLAAMPGEWLAGLPRLVQATRATAAAAMIIMGVLNGRRITKILETGPLKWLGKVSFALYLLHLPILLSAGVTVFLWTNDHGAGYGISLLAAYLGSLLVLFPASGVFTRSVDQTAIGVSRKLAGYFA